MTLKFGYSVWVHHVSVDSCNLNKSKISNKDSAVEPGNKTKVHTYAQECNYGVVMGLDPFPWAFHTQ